MLVRTRSSHLALGYSAVAAWATWPAVIHWGQRVPGADRTDLFNSLWSLWFVQNAVRAGELPLRTDLLNHPDGGTLWVADTLGALFAMPLIPWLGLASTYTLLVLAHIVFSGWVVHRFAEDVVDASGVAVGTLGRWSGMISPAWVAGVGYATAPVLLSSVHNGTSEALAGGWAALAAWRCWRVATNGSVRNVVIGVICLALAALGSGYGAVVAFLFAGSLALLGNAAGWRKTWVARLTVLGVGIAVVVPIGVGVHAAATATDNLVGIKHPRELQAVRRTTGPADPVGFFAMGDYRSPDFRVMSRYGERFFHCHYLGWALLVGSLMALFGVGRRRGTGFLWMAGGFGLLLSVGPVLVRYGTAVIVLTDRAIPLPYLLVEGIPGFNSLSLLYRLTQAPALALALLAAVGVASRDRWGLAVLVVLLEGRLLCPLGALPDTTNIQVAPSIRALQRAPAGAVMNFPVAGGRAYLYEQTVHSHPVAGGLNFPNNSAAKRVWKEMLAQADAPSARFRTAVTSRARAAGIRYVVVHRDPMARPDMHDTAVRALEESFAPLEVSVEDGVRDGLAVEVIPLW